VPERVRAEALREPGPAPTLATGVPHRFVCDRPLLICFHESRRKQIDLGLHFASSPVCPECIQKLRREWQFPIARVFTLMDMNDHALAVDIGDLQLRGFGPPETSSVQKQQDRSVANVGCGLDQLLDFLRVEHYGKFLRHSTLDQDGRSCPLRIPI